MGSPLCKVKTKQPMLCAHLFVLNQTVFANPVPNPRTVHCLDLHYTFSLSLNWLLSKQNWTLNTYKVAALLTQGHRVKTVLLQLMRLWHIKRNIRHGLPLKSHWTQYQIHKPVRQVPLPIMIIKHKQPFLIGRQNLRQYHHICQGLD